MALQTPVTIRTFAEKFFEHIHAFAAAKDGTSRCIICDEAECSHNDRHEEIRTMPASRDYFGWSEEYDYKVSVCNVCKQVSKQIPQVDWNTYEDDLPY